MAVIVIYHKEERDEGKEAKKTAESVRMESNLLARAKLLHERVLSFEESMPHSETMRPNPASVTITDS